MHYLTCTMISSVDIAHYGVFCAKDWVFVDYGTKYVIENFIDHFPAVFQIQLFEVFYGNWL